MVGGARDEPCGLGAANELDRAVVPYLEPLGERGDVGAGSLREPAYGQEELVLLRLDPSLARSRLAERQELPDGMSDVGERAVFAACYGWGAGHSPIYIVSRYSGAPGRRRAGSG